ncbi:MAG: hypothetical protein M3410_18620 [Acidobacteriota bacterium]|nr:hypothetical protein [Acidobacteriota bacterium]
MRSFFQKAADSPETYDIREPDLGRVNLERFPYHFLFRIVRDRVRVLVVRHHPSPAMSLKEIFWWAKPGTITITNETGNRLPPQSY